MNFKNILLILSCILFLGTTNAQTQEEIERMLNGGSSTTTEETSKPKKVKEPKAEKVKTEKVKTKKEPKQAKVKEEKAPKEAKVKEEKAAKPEKVKAVKEEKVKAEKAPKEVKASSSAKPSSSGSSSSRSSMPQKPYRTWNLGFYGGLAHPVTDIRYKDWFGTLDPVNENQWSAGIKATKMFDAAFGVQFRGSYNVLQGAFDSLVIHKEDRTYLEDAGISEGIYFRNNVISSSINVYWNISNTVFGTNRYLKAKAANKPQKPRKFSMFMFSGIGGTWFDPHVMALDDKAPASLAGVDFQVDRTFEINIPIGVGAKFNLGKSTDLGFEYVINYVFTDKLDGYTFDHPGRIKNDLYTNLNLTLDFKLGSKKKADEHIEWIQPTSKLYDEISRIDDLDRKLKKVMQDDDEDGVSDFFDKDTETEKGIIVDGSGRALDSDGDGVADKKDLEPFSDADADVDEFGVSKDDDMDGVPNHKDLENDTKKGEFVNFQGVAIDGKVKPAETRGLSFPSVFFDTDKATIKREYEEELFMVALDMIRMESLNFVLTGHCDERGSEEYNNELGQRRADAVKNYLVENYEIDANRIQTVSKGKSEINSPRFNINRRVDILIIEK